MIPTQMESMLDLFENRDIQTQIKHAISPIAKLLYNEIYLYIWFICLYNVFLFFIVLANLFILLRLVKVRSD